jgi:hypothetical protein
VLSRVRASALGRLGAAAVAVALAGVPALSARADHAAEHRCACRHARGQECACARCHETARRVAPVAQEAAPPPCHGPRAAAPAQKPRRDAGVPAGPRVSGCCGAPEAPGVAPTGIDRFTLPSASAPPAPRVGAGEVTRVESGPRDAPDVPETPPPRAV